MSTTGKCPKAYSYIRFSTPDQAKGQAMSGRLSLPKPMHGSGA